MSSRDSYFGETNFVKDCFETGVIMQRVPVLVQKEVTKRAIVGSGPVFVGGA